MGSVNKRANGFCDSLPRRFIFLCRAQPEQRTKVLQCSVRVAIFIHVEAMHHDLALGELEALAAPGPAVGTKVSTGARAGRS